MPLKGRRKRRCFSAAFFERYGDDTMSMISVSDLTFSYDGGLELLFDRVSFQFDTDWKLGFTGRNGRGKTTFLKLLAGELEYRGSISSPVPVTYFPFPVGDPGRNALEIAEETAPGREFWELCRELSLLGMEADVLFRPFDTLSGGEQVKLLLAALFLNDGRYLLIDEPTNHLDMEGRELLAGYLRKKKGFLLVSHDRAFLDGCVDHILSINRADIEIQKGNFSSWAENKRRQDEFERAEHQKLGKEISRLKEAARRTAGWSDAVEKTKTGSKNSGLRPDRGYIGHKSAKMMKRAKSAENRRQKALEDRQKLLKNLEEADRLKLSPLVHHAGCLVEAKELCIAYPGTSPCVPVRFSLQNGERVALTGKNGCGKTSVLKLLLGEEVPHTGTLTTASGLIVSHVSQRTDFLQGSLTDFSRENGLDDARFRTILRKLDVSRSLFEQDMASYSEGQKKKVLLAKSLCQQAHLYVWDEPLNYIDVLSRMQIEELILKYRPTLLFVEHDRAFVERCANRVIRMG